MASHALAQGKTDPLLKATRQAVYSAEDNPARLAKLIEEGQPLVAPCVGCHGPYGRSGADEIPSLAGQSAVYLMVQLQKFIAGTRPHELMRSVVQAYSDTDRLRIALFFSSQSPRNPEKVTPDDKRYTNGKRLFSEDFCHQCHGLKAEGGDLVPRLGGQPKVYLERSLTYYRARSGERRDTMMSLVLGRLSDSDIKDLAEYLATLE